MTNVLHSIELLTSIFFGSSNHLLYEPRQRFLEPLILRLQTAICIFVARSE